MKLLERIQFAAKTALLDAEPVDEPTAGQHSEAGLIHRLQQEVELLRSGFNPELEGYKDALRKAAQDVWAAEQEAARYKNLFGQADRGWRSADAEVKRLRVLLSARTPGEPETAPQPAAADRPDFQPEPADPPTPDRDRDQLPPIALTLPRPETYEPASLTDATRRDESLRSLALPGEEEMAAELEAMRSANLTTTVTLPVIPDRPAIPDEAAARLNIPGPHPFASATAIPREAVANAVTSVAAIVSEAS